MSDPVVMTLTAVTLLAADPVCGADLIHDPYTLAGYAYTESGYLDHGVKMVANKVSAVNTNGSRDYGVAQINENNFGWLGLTYQTAMDPCHSLHAAAQYLVSMSRYNTGDPNRGFQNGYVSRAIAAMDAVKGKATAAIPIPTTTAKAVPLGPVGTLQTQMLSAPRK